MDKTTNIKKNLIKHLSFYLVNKLYLLKKEAEHTKLSLEYIQCLNITNKNINKNQFLLDIKSILNLNEAIINKIDEIKDKMQKIDQNKTLLDLIIEYDCINKRINNSLIKKYEYVHIAYENLVLSHNFLYLPTITISKAAKTPNLMLYFNYMINDIYNKLDNENNNYNKLFSTWNFIATDKIYPFFNEQNDENKKTYIEFSFWLYEMPIFHSISFHELFHAYYDKYMKNHIDLKFNDEDFIYIKDNLPEKIINVLGITTDLLVKIFEEILADIFSYLLIGENYIYTLFINGFMFNISDFFYKRDEKKCCLEKEKTILNFEFNNKEFMYILRMYSLLDFVIAKGKKDNFIEFVEEMFNFIFPNDNYKQKYENFEKVLENFVTYKDYLLIKESFFIFRLLFKNILIKKNVFEQLEKLYLDLKNKCECSFFDSYKELFSLYKNKIEDLKDCKSDVFVEINHLLQKEYRRKNIIHIINDENIKRNNDGEIYYLTFIKMCRNQTNDAFLFYKDINENQNNDIKYAFGPYDFVNIHKKSSKFIKQLENFFRHNDSYRKFFIENHSLYLLDNKDNHDNGDKEKFFDLLFLFDIKEAFNNFDNMKNFYNEMKNFLQNENRYKFFISMGNENFVLKIDYLNNKEIEEKINSIHKSAMVKNYVNHLSTTVLFNERILNNIDKQEELHSFDISNIIILLKVDLSKMNEVISILNEFKVNYFIKKDKDKKMFIYKKLGIYDIVVIFNKINIKELHSLITNIDNYVLDVQIEKEIKV